MPKRATNHRPPIFRDATPPRGPSITPRGSRRFTEVRIRLAKLAGLEVEQVGDRDVEEFIRRGELAAQKYLARTKSAQNPAP